MNKNRKPTKAGGGGGGWGGGIVLLKELSGDSSIWARSIKHQSEEGAYRQNKMR